MPKTSGFERKIKTLGALKKICVSLKARGKRIVFTNGCFDILHFGHAQYLQAANEKGDILVVAVNSDASIKKIKGSNRPIINERDRIKTVAALESVDYVFLFGTDTPLEAIEALRPQVLVKGADWNKNNIVGADIVRASGGKICTIKLAAGRSTTGLIDKIVRTFANKGNRSYRRCKP